MAFVLPDDGVEWVPGAIRRQSNLFESILSDGMMQPHFEATLGLPTGYRYRKVVDLLDYYYPPDVETVERTIRVALAAHDALLHTFIQRTYSAGQNLLAIAADIAATDDLPTLTNAELAVRYRAYADAALNTVPMAFASFQIEQIIEEQIREEIQRSGAAATQSEADDLFYDLVSYNVGTTDYALVEERALLALAARIQENILAASSVQIAFSPLDLPADVQQALARHCEEHGWINTDGYIGQPWCAVDVLPRLQRWLRHDCSAKLRSISRRQSEGEDRRREAIRKCGGGASLRAMVDVAAAYVELRPYRPMVLIRSGYLARPLLTEIARRVEMSYNDILLFTHNEVSDLISGQLAVSNDEVPRRRGRRGCLVIDARTTWYFGNDVDLLDERPDQTTDLSEITEITGQVANRGVAIGKARLFVNLLNLPEIDDGDIIVASMTMPDMMPAMERAGAYVTDEGGITCHAAIVSRELDVPCVIGTEIATRVIRDGDIVEVDANRGRVVVQSRKVNPDNHPAKAAT